MANALLLDLLRVSINLCDGLGGVSGIQAASHFIWLAL
jgi:hypothetical protein